MIYDAMLHTYAKFKDFKYIVGNIIINTII